MTYDNTGYIWLKMLGDSNAKQSSNNAKTLRKALADFVSQLPTPLRICETGACLSRENLDKLLDNRPETMPLDSYIRFVRSVAKYLGKGKKELGWDVAIPAIPVKISREPARFTPQLFGGMATLRLLEQAVLKTTRSSSQDIELGRLLLSVIIFGGIVNTKWIELWINAFNKIAFNKDLILWDGDCLWFETSSIESYGRKKNDGSDGKKKRGDGEKEILLQRRWFADPVSSILICNWVANPDNHKKKIPKELYWFKLVKIFMKTAGLDPTSVESATKLLKMAETGLSLKVPPFLAAFATRDITSVSLPEPVWARISTGFSVINTAQENSAASEELDDSAQNWGAIRFVDNSGEKVVPSHQQDLLRKIRRCFYKNGHALTSRAVVSSEIERIIDYGVVSPIVRLLAHWAFTLLTAKAPLAASSVKRYLGAIGGHLAALCCLDDFFDLESVEYQEIYEQVIEQIVSDKERSYALRVLCDFHSFLVKDFGFPNIEHHDFLSNKGPAECSVDANLITCAEFDRVKVALGSENPHRSDMATAALLIAILGFRCGLRRNEILYIRISDLYEDTSIELVLKPNSLRGLKSKRSKRRLLLDTLLQPDELTMFFDWWDKKLGHDRHAFLFTPDHHLIYKDRPYTDKDVFTPITKALRIVTGDETIRFHHLRHSFATWMLLRLTGSSEGLRGRASFLDHPEFDDSRITQLRSNLLDNETLGRKGAYAISALCGHSNPGTTFNSYIHLCDWLLGQELSQNSTLPAIEIASISALSGISPATVYRYTSKAGRVDWRQLSRIASKRANLAKYDVSDRIYCQDGQTIEYSDEAELKCLWATAMQVLKYFQVDKKSLLEVDQFMRIGIPMLERWLSEALRIANLKTRAGGKGYRHRIPARYLERVRICGENREVWKKRDGVLVKTYQRWPKRTKSHPKQPTRDYLEFWKKSVSQATCPERFPYAPRSKRDLDLLYSIMITFEKLTTEEQLGIITFTEYFCQHFSLNGGGIWYKEPEQAVIHLDVLKKLGIAKNKIVLVDLETFGEDVTSLNIRRRLWEEQLGFDRATWVVAESRKSFKRISCGIGIKVLETAGVKNKASYAVRYAMYLIRITYGYKLQKT